MRNADLRNILQQFIGCYNQEKSFTLKKFAETLHEDLIPLFQEFTMKPILETSPDEKQLRSIVLDAIRRIKEKFTRDEIQQLRLALKIAESTGDTKKANSLLNLIKLKAQRIEDLKTTT
jgi:predicted DNA-binding transcriptional regulator YafY